MCDERGGRASRRWANGEKWTDDCVKNLITHRHVPDFWDTTMDITYGLVKLLIGAINTSGTSNNLAMLRESIQLLVPSAELTSMPTRYALILRKLNTKSLNESSNVPWASKISEINTVGPIASSLGLEANHLRNNDLPMPIVHPISCGLVLELRKFWYQNSFSWGVFAGWLSRMSGNKINLDQKETRRKVDILSKEHLNLCKRKTPPSVFAAFNAREFVPVADVPKVDSTEEQIHENYVAQLAVLKSIDVSVQTLCCDLQVAQPGCSWREKFLNLKQEYEKCAAQLKVLRSSLNRDKKNSARREKRRDEKLTAEKTSSRRLQEQLVDTTQKLQKVCHDKRQVGKQRHYYQQRAKNLHQQSQQQQVDLQLSTVQLRTATDLNRRLVEEVQSILAEKLQVSTFSEGHYSDAIRETVMGLGSLGVSAANISKVICLVANSLFSVELERLPSSSTVKQCLTEANIVGKLQVCERLIQSNNVTLHVDGTTDHQRHFFGYQISTGNSQLALTVRETVPSDAATQLQELQDTVAELARLVTRDDKEREDLSANMLLGVKNLMTDQAATNKKFKQEYEDLRLTLVNKSESAWSSLGEDEKTKVVSLNHWFCFLHVLLGFAESTERGLKDYEDIVTASWSVPIGRYKVMPDARRDSSATLECIKATCALLTPSGHAAAGIPEDFRAFMMTREQKKVRLVKFAHTRFNVVYHNASAVWHHRLDIAEFLTTGSNQLVSAVQGDLCDPTLLACLRGVAIFHVVITAPFHRLILSEVGHILDLNQALRRLQETLEVLSSDPWRLGDDLRQWCGRDAMEKETWLVGCLPASKEEDNLDITMEVLSLLATHGLVIFSRQVASHLPGGEHAAATGDVRAQSASVPTSNSIGESQFALLKHLRHVRPNATVENMEGTILWAYNKTLQWLQSLPADKRRDILETARQRKTEFKAMWMQRRKRLLEQRNTERQHKEIATQEKACKSVFGRQKAVEGVQSDGGQCRTEEDVDVLVDQQGSEKELVGALKAQMRFYKSVIKCPNIDKSLYAFSHKGFQFPGWKLALNLKAVVRQYTQYLSHIPSTSGTSQVPQPLVRQQQVEKVRKAVLCQYRSDSNARPVNSAKRKGDFPDPVGKRIRHRWKVGKRHRWYQGQVVGVCGENELPSFTDDEDQNTATSSIYQLYRVLYDGEEEEFRLRAEKDWYRGDLEFVEW